MQKYLSHIVRALTVLCLTTALCGIAPAKDHRTTGTAPVMPTYRVVPLGSHAFSGLGVIPLHVQAKLTRLGVFGFLDRDVNRRGERIAGEYSDISRAYLVRHGKKHPLSPLPGNGQCEAIAINDKGNVVGASWSMDDDYTAVLWRQGKVYNLAAHCVGKWNPRDFGPCPFGRGVAINNRGQIVAMSIDDPSRADFYLLEPVQTSARP